MSYVKWETKESLKESLNLKGINKNNNPEHAGLPIMYDENALYIDSRLNHSLIIGTKESYVKESIILPMLELSCLSNESVIVHNSTKEIYELTKEKFENNGYNIIKIDFDDLKNSNHWNPLDLISKIYNSGDEDKAQELIENLGHNLICDNESQNSDPFWVNSAVNYFTGIILYTLKNKNNINFNDIIETDQLVQKNPKEFIEKIDKKSNIYANLVGVLASPNETRDSIIAVFNQKIKKYFSKQNLINTMSKSDFDIENISSEKTIIYIISGDYDCFKNLCPVLISQVYSSKKGNNRLNIIIDDFYKLNPINDFGKILDHSLNLNISFTIIIRGFSDLKKAYGKEHTEIIKICCSNILYLLSNDLETLEEISNLCGNTENNGKIESLISMQELKTLKAYEGIYITTRIMPYKTKLLPISEFKN